MAPLLDTTEAQARLTAAQALTQGLSDAVGHQGARALKGAATEQARLLESLTKTADLTSTGPRAQLPVPAFASPLLLIEAPSSIAFTTAATLLTYAGSHHQASVQGDAHFSAGQTFSSISGPATSLYTHTGGITAIAAHHPVSIQAHRDTLEVLADQSVTITSTDAGITVLADQKIVLIAGGAAITLDSENITFACPGTFSVCDIRDLVAFVVHDGGVVSVLAFGNSGWGPQLSSAFSVCRRSERVASNIFEFAFLRRGTQRA